MVRGRAVVANGTPSVWIQPDGSKRVLGVVPAEDEIEPESVKRTLSFDADVAGDFTVCPFTRKQPDSMQLVCIERVQHAVVRRRGEDGPARLRPAEEKAIKAAVDDQAKRLARPNDPLEEPYPEPRRIARGELDGDGQPDLVVLFTLEQGNNWMQFLAAFAGPKAKPLGTARVGRKGERSVAIEGLAQGRIDLSTKSYGPSDALCCPSVAGRSSWILRSGALVEK